MSERTVPVRTVSERTMSERTVDDDLVERVLLAVEHIPPGRVATYGDIGEVIGLGPRQVGAVMSAYGSSVPWWRVVSASGTLPEHVLGEALQRWRAEGIPIAANGRGCRLAAVRADAVVWDSFDVV